jgi:hypothetical protein
MTFPSSLPSLASRLLEATSLAQCLETQPPPNPITQAALKHSVQDPIAELRAFNFQLQLEQAD